MVELTVLNGSEPGRLLRLNRFPTRVGRRCEGEGLLVGPGIWDHHFDVVREESGRFGLVVAKGARVAMEGEFIERSTLKNGGILEAGGLRLRFRGGFDPTATEASRACRVDGCRDPSVAGGVDDRVGRTIGPAMVRGSRRRPIQGSAGRHLAGWPCGRGAVQC